jgi:pyridoxamine 5'-phosphate oxidase
MQVNVPKRTLSETELAPDPVSQFRLWFDVALQAGIPEAHAMTLATATRDGAVSARIVLLKSFDERGFCFFTNDQSRKGKALAENPRAALVFFWQPLERQVRIEGTVSQMTDEEADDYFQTRPVLSQIGALASPQSSCIPNREFLEDHFRQLSRRYQGETIPRPEHWGGYRLAPQVVEFWQGRENRLHDRLVYRRRDDGGWGIERLAP